MPDRPIQRRGSSSHDRPHPSHQTERSRQVRGLLVLAILVILFILLRAGVPSVFYPGWWRLW